MIQSCGYLTTVSLIITLPLHPSFCVPVIDCYQGVQVGGGRDVVVEGNTFKVQ
jgi:hypothetical protein